MTDKIAHVTIGRGYSKEEIALLKKNLMEDIGCRMAWIEKEPRPSIKKEPRPSIEKEARPCLFPDILDIFGCPEYCPITGCHGEECPSDLWDAIEKR